MDGDGDDFNGEEEDEMTDQTTFRSFAPYVADVDEDVDDRDEKSDNELEFPFPAWKGKNGSDAIAQAAEAYNEFNTLYKRYNQDEEEDDEEGSKGKVSKEEREKRKKAIEKAREAIKAIVIPYVQCCRRGRWSCAAIKWVQSRWVRAPDPSTFVWTLELGVKQADPISKEVLDHLPIELKDWIEMTNELGVTVDKNRVTDYMVQVWAAKCYQEDLNCRSWYRPITSEIAQVILWKFMRHTAVYKR